MNTDENSPDPGALIVDGTHIDPFQGMLSAAVFLKRTYGALTEDDPRKRGQAKDYMERFARSKLTPLAGVLPSRAHGTTLGYDENGKPKKATWGEIAKDVTIPLTFENIADAMDEQGIPKKAGRILLSFFGMRINKYNGSTANKSSWGFYGNDKARK